MNTQVRDLGMVVFSIILLVIAFLSLMRVDQYLKIKAIDDCGKVARYEYSGTDGSRTTAPNEESYRACLNDKGVVVK